MPEPEYPTVTIPLEAWRQVIRVAAQLEAMNAQLTVIIARFCQLVDAIPADEAGNLGEGS